MKKILAILLFISVAASAQDSNKVWDLLLKNDREGARAQFDKSLKKKKDSDIELLTLDAIINLEMGQVFFDGEYLRKLAQLQDSEYYLYPVWYQNFAVSNPYVEGYNDLVFEKLDYVAQADKFKDFPHVIYVKAVSDRQRLDFDGFNKGIEKLGAINNWQYCGVFENLNGSGLDTEYEPELYAKNDKVFNANSNGLVGWYVPAIPQAEGYHFYYNEREYGNGVIYAQTFITSDADKPVVLHLGTSGPIKVFANDTEIYSNDKASNTDLNAFLIRFNLKKGTNRLLIKSATTGGSDYFYAALKDENGKKPAGITISEKYADYQRTDAAALNATELLPDFESYLSKKHAAQKDNVFYALCLYDGYMANHKKEKAFEVLEPLVEKYPESSLLKVKQLQYYSQMDNEQKAEELKQSLILKDPGYYYSIVSKFGEDNWISEANISELTLYRDRAKKLKSDIYGILYDYFLATRNRDIDLSIQKVEELIKASYNNEKFIANFADLYTSLKSNKEKTISIYEEMVKTRNNAAAQNKLISYYHSSGRKDEALKLINDRIARYPYFNYVYDDLITLSNGDNNYEQTLKYTTTGLKNFPYSFKLMEAKGQGYNSLKNNKEAEAMFRQSLQHNSANSRLRKTLYAITNMPDEIEKLATSDIYKLIEKRRNSTMPNDYGVNILFDEYIINVLPEGSRKTKTTYVYEITSENGIEELKEYEFGGGNIIKAEIVKPDGKVVPGDRSYSTVVFTNLNVKDVVYIEFENTAAGSGRFYKDFNYTYYFNGTYPSKQTKLTIITPEDVQYATNVSNGSITSKTGKINGRNYVTWERTDVPTMPLYENFAFGYYDLANQVEISSIKSWGEIANWYADLVKKSLKTDNIAERTYAEIFPKGIAGLKDEEKAYRIYKYIEDNITYSSLDFRQSGYIPQKPSKTITTKLGDCKDVSTLFVYMAQKAGLDAKLTLVLTADNGIKAVNLPAISFNHCIVKLMLEGKEHYLELTNRYLPFKAIPLSLYRAKALVISFDKKENDAAKLINIPGTGGLDNEVKTVTVVNIDDNVKKFRNTHSVKGRTKSYYNELFSDSATDEVRRKEFEEDINSRLNKVVSMESVKLINNDRYADEITFETAFAISEKLQSVGSLKIMEVPYMDKAYTRDIIANEKRNYDIDYASYENVNKYDSEVILNLPEGRKFTEIPENREYKFKGHSYTIGYELVKPNSLRVKRLVIPSWDTIKTEDYAGYKAFVENVLATEEEIIGFK